MFTDQQNQVSLLKLLSDQVFTDQSISLFVEAVIKSDQVLTDQSSL